MDADVYGPNVPIMLGTHAEPQAHAGQAHHPGDGPGHQDDFHGAAESRGQADDLARPDAAQRHHAIFAQRGLGELDYLLIDLPPGTGDVQLTLIQTVAVTGAVIVTTPSTVALADVRKAIEMFRQVNVEVLGVVENMSTFSCPHCGKSVDIFGHGDGAITAKDYGVPLLGEIEIDPRIRVGGDSGKPVAALGEDGAGAQEPVCGGTSDDCAASGSGR